MDKLKQVFSFLIPTKGSKNRSNSSKMVSCPGPINISPYQIDFGAAYLCSRLKLENAAAFYDICDLLIRLRLNAILPTDFHRESQIIHPDFSALFSKFNEFNRAKQCKYRIQSSVTQEFVDDLCYFIWHYGNNSWKDIAFLMFNGQNSEYITVYIKHIYTHSCCFKVPATSLQSLYDILYENFTNSS